jgi:hypothetical protein
VPRRRLLPGLLFATKPSASAKWTKAKDPRGARPSSERGIGSARCPRLASPGTEPRRDPDADAARHGDPRGRPRFAGRRRQGVTFVGATPRVGLACVPLVSLLRSRLDRGPRALPAQPPRRSQFPFLAGAVGAAGYAAGTWATAAPGTTAVRSPWPNGVKPISAAYRPPSTRTGTARSTGAAPAVRPRHPRHAPPHPPSAANGAGSCGTLRPVGAARAG